MLVAWLVRGWTFGSVVHLVLALGVVAGAGGWLVATTLLVLRVPGLEDRGVGLARRLAAVESESLWRTKADRGCFPDRPADPPTLSLAPMADGFSKPVYVAAPRDGTDRLFVVEKGGTIRVLPRASSATPGPAQLFLDLRGKVLSDESEPAGSWQQGLLGMAFHPNHAENGSFYAFYTDFEGRIVVAEYHVDPKTGTASAEGERRVLEIDHPDYDDLGGQLTFGPDGYLYVGTGDQSPTGRGLQSLLGKILRVDVDQRSDERGYSIPPDNPYVGFPEARAEIYAAGFRNPWRFSFDRCDGSLIAADPGEDDWEEIDVVRLGGDYGWPAWEADRCRLPFSCASSANSRPIFRYSHVREDLAQGGNAVIGGYVYRGSRHPSLRGFYLLADYTTHGIWTLAPDPARPGIWLHTPRADVGHPIVSFGESEDGELYAVSYSGTILRVGVARPRAE